MSIVLLYEIDYTLEQQAKLEKKLENRRARSRPGRSELVKSVSGTAYTVSNVVGSFGYLNSPRCLRLRRAAAAVTQASASHTVLLWDCLSRVRNLPCIKANSYQSEGTIFPSSASGSGHAGQPRAFGGGHTQSQPQSAHSDWHSPPTVIGTVFTTGHAHGSALCQLSGRQSGA